MPCPSPTELACFALRTLDADAVARIETHVDGCAACRGASSAVVTISRTDELDGDPAWTGARPEPGARFDRYVILHQLGEGAASVVYAAYDPELDRKVALKLLRSRGADLDDRLLRESRALARLSDPNVVTVYEVGDAGGQLYIALELVEGVTARQWAAIAPRTWRELRDVYTAAGRGLAALHRAGLVHRDVKPDNIVVARGGGVRLVDFGLVGAGAGAGTPAYMAPEVTAGARGDAASDQYGLCAALADGLAGPGAIADPGRITAPRRIRRAIERGLAADPVARFPSVTELVAALGDRPRWHVAVPAALALGAAGAVAVIALGAGGGAAAPCADAAAGLYPASTSAAIDRALGASTRPHAAATRARVVPALEHRAVEWRTDRTAVCRAYHEQHAISADRFDRQVACLDRQRAAFGFTVARIARGDADGIDHAIELVGALPPGTECRDDASLARAEPMPPDPAARAAIEGIEATLSEAEVALRAGDPAGALARAEAALGRARTAAYRPALARAAYTVADLLDRAGDDDRARPLIDEAIRVAAEARTDAIEARAWILRLYVLGVVGEAGDAELAAARSAGEAAAARAGDAMTRARLANTLGLVLKARGDYPGARDQYRAALALLAATDPQAGEVASTQANLSEALAVIGDVAGARAAAQDAAARDLATFGPDHPSYGDSLVGLAQREIELGEGDAAVRHLEQALAITVATYGDASVPAMVVHHNLAGALGQSGKLDAAEPHATLALELAEKLRGPAHTATAEALLTVANLAAAREDYARAEEVAGRALAIVTATYGAAHPMAASITANLGAWALMRGDGAAAERHARTALAAMTATPDSPFVAMMRTVLGDALIAQGKPALAIAELEAALAQRERIGDDPVEIADSKFTLARALWDVGKKPRAIALARAAGEVFVDGGLAAAPYVAAMKHWAERVHAEVPALARAQPAAELAGP